jgi:replicative DNA helicase
MTTPIADMVRQMLAAGVPHDMIVLAAAEPVHGLIFRVCGELIGAGKTATPISLKTCMPPDAIAGLTPSQYLARLAAEATSVVMAADYAHQIRELAAKREIIAAGEDLIEAGKGAGQSFVVGDVRAIKAVSVVSVNTVPAEKFNE